MAARPLRDVFTELTGDADARGGDPAEALRASGHDGLPDELVAEAVVSFADTAPIEVAEHLAPYVAANSAVPSEGIEADPSGWLDALATAPTIADLDGHDPAADLDPTPDLAAAPAGSAADDPLEHTGEAADVDFGLGDSHGVDPLDALDAPHDTSYAVASLGTPGESTEPEGDRDHTGVVPSSTVDDPDAGGPAGDEGGDEPGFA